jgi:hypothetical protein
VQMLRSKAAVEILAHCSRNMDSQSCDDCMSLAVDVYMFAAENYIRTRRPADACRVLCEIWRATRHTEAVLNTSTFRMVKNSLVEAAYDTCWRMLDGKLARGPDDAIHDGELSLFRETATCVLDYVLETDKDIARIQREKKLPPDELRSKTALYLQRRCGNSKWMRFFEMPPVPFFEKTMAQKNTHTPRRRANPDCQTLSTNKTSRSPRQKPHGLGCKNTCLASRDKIQPQTPSCLQISLRDKDTHDKAKIPETHEQNHVTNNNTTDTHCQSNATKTREHNQVRGQSRLCEQNKAREQNEARGQSTVCKQSNVCEQNEACGQSTVCKQSKVCEQSEVHEQSTVCEQNGACEQSTGKHRRDNKVSVV